MNTLEKMIHWHRECMKDILTLIEYNKKSGREVDMVFYIDRYLIHYESINSLWTLLARQDLKKIR